MASFEGDMESLVELRVRHWRPVIVQCIQTHQFCSRLASLGIITDDLRIIYDTATEIRQNTFFGNVIIGPETVEYIGTSIVEKTRLCDLYRNKTFHEASNELLDLVIKKQQAGKWALFLQALDDEGMEFVKSRLTASAVELPEEREQRKAIIQFFAPDLEKNIEDLVKVTTLLKRDKVINEVDVQEIMNLKMQRSTAHAVQCLLARMQCHKRPEEWYFAFLCALRDAEYQHLVNKMEPNFLDKPSAFMPKLSSICRSTDMDEKEHLLEEMSAVIYQKVSLPEERLKFWRKEIVRCLDKPTILSQLAASDVFNEDEMSRLYDIYQTRTATEAGEAVLDSFDKSSAPNKWVSFLNALEQEELIYVKSLLEEDNVDSEEDRLRGRKLIRLFGPELEKSINPIDIISSLISKNAIAQEDSEEVLNLYQTKGRLYGIRCLLRRMQTRLRPKEWYYAFLCALRDNNYYSECNLLEPDFLECPHMFDPETFVRIS